MNYSYDGTTWTFGDEEVKGHGSTAEAAKKMYERRMKAKDLLKKSYGASWKFVDASKEKAERGIRQ